MNDKILEMIKAVEFNNDNSLLLHKNDGENGLTFYGIYQSAHPNWNGWKIINRYLEVTPNLKQCSVILSGVSDLNKLVIEFYKVEFWNKLELDLITSEHKQLEIMCFAINAGITPCVKVLQELINVKIDGVIGEKTIKAINEFSESDFDRLFDVEEKEYYDELILNKSRFKKYQKGWHNRAYFV